MILDEVLILEHEVDNWEVSLPKSWLFTEEVDNQFETHSMEACTPTVIYEQREFGIIFDGHKEAAHLPTPPGGLDTHGWGLRATGYPLDGFNLLTFTSNC